MKPQLVGKTVPKIQSHPAKLAYKKSWFGLAMAPILLGLLLLVFSPQSGAVQLKRAACDAAKTELRNTSSLFPVIPDKLTSKNGNPETDCIPANWDKDILILLVYRGLGILNYVAGAIAILATIWGGAIYLFSSGESEKMKQAKTLIIGTYVGFLIVLLARVMINATFYIFGTGTNFDLIEQFESNLNPSTPNP